MPSNGLVQRRDQEILETFMQAVDLFYSFRLVFVSFVVVVRRHRRRSWRHRRLICHICSYSCSSWCYCRVSSGRIQAKGRVVSQSTELNFRPGE